MCFDPASKSIFVFGQYVDPMVVHNTHVTADFYRYFIEYDHWVKLSDDTAVSINLAQKEKRRRNIVILDSARVDRTCCMITRCVSMFSLKKSTFLADGLCTLIPADRIMVGYIATVSRITSGRP